MEYKAKEDRQRLEQRISWMQGQLVNGGQLPPDNLNDTSWVAEQQRKQYSMKYVPTRFYSLTIVDVRPTIKSPFPR
jgi:hypothetical protein